MNRGILLSRGVPTKADLIKSAEGICSGNVDASRLMKSTTKLLADGYSRVYQRQEREYFGLRDFYSLVKMVYAMVERNGREPSREDITYAVQRNFGGYFGELRPTQVFLSAIYQDITEEALKPAKALVMEALRQKEETRYILLLTKNNAALSIIQDQVGGKLAKLSQSSKLFVMPVQCPPPHTFLNMVEDPNRICCRISVHLVLFSEV
jgi:hypothetical protein